MLHSLLGCFVMFSSERQAMHHELRREPVHLQDLPDKTCVMLCRRHAYLWRLQGETFAAALSPVRCCRSPSTVLVSLPLYVPMLL